jgi:hypothetical protein
VFAFSAAMARLPSHWSVAVAPLKAIAQTTPWRVTSAAYSLLWTVKLSWSADLWFCARQSRPSAAVLGASAQVAHQCGRFGSDAPDDGKDKTD